jgi:hypothetical protein
MSPYVESYTVYAILGIILGLVAYIIFAKIVYDNILNTKRDEENE